MLYKHGIENSWFLFGSYISLYQLEIMAQQLQGGAKRNQRLPPEVNRILFVRNLPFKITAEEMYDIFGKYGALRQIRM